MEIQQFNLGILHNGDHLHYNQQVEKLVEDTGPQLLGIDGVWHSYTDMIEEEDKVMALTSKSPETDELAAADRERDLLVSWLGYQLNADVHHYDLMRRQAGHRIRVVFKSFDNIVRKDYNEETANINTLCKELTSNHVDDVATLQLSDWIEKVTISNQKFDGLFIARVKDIAEKTLVRMKGLRVDMDDSYRNIIKRINAKIILNGDQGVAGFVNQMNELIDYYHDQMAVHLGRVAANKKEEQPEIKAN